MYLNLVLKVQYKLARRKSESRTFLEEKRTHAKIGECEECDGFQKLHIQWVKATAGRR